MPGMDGTGPYGTGSIGRGLGPCGRGLRRGFVRGLGFRYREPVFLNKEEQKKILEQELKEIDLEKREIEKKIKELK